MVKIRLIAPLFFAIASLDILAVISFSQTPQNVFSEPCGSTRSARDPLVDEAHTGEFTIKDVEFVGATYTRGRDLFKQARSVNEGNIFTRENLQLAVKRLSRMSVLYPLSLDDVEVRLDRADKYIDISFCVRQKPKR